MPIAAPVIVSITPAELPPAILRDLKAIEAQGGLAALKNQPAARIADQMSRRWHPMGHTDIAHTVNAELGWFRMYESSLVIEVKLNDAGRWSVRAIGRQTN